MTDPYTSAPLTAGLGDSNAQYESDEFSSFSQTEALKTGRAFTACQATPALLPGAGWAYTKASGDTDAKHDQVSLGGVDSLSKRIDTYLVGTPQHAGGAQHVEYGTTQTVQAAQASIDSYDHAGTRSREIVALGLRHEF